MRLSPPWSRASPLAPPTPMTDETEHCPTCGTEVEVVSSDEGTSFYRPVEREVLAEGMAIHLKIIRNTSREERDG